MGVTVHFEGKLKNDGAFLQLISRVEQVASEEAVATERFETQEAKLSRVRDEKDWDYVGRTKGIILYLHEDCEPVRLEFDGDLYIQEWVKTQFAGARVHARLVALLRDLEVFFEWLKVEDEGEYWRTGDQRLLAEHMRQCDQAIADLARDHPAAQVKVREPNGRYTDIIT